MPEFLISQKTVIPDFGKVNIRVLSTARNLIARWKKDILHITLPPYTTEQQLNEFLRLNRDTIVALHKDFEPLYFDGYTYECELCRIRVVESPRQKRGYVSSKVDRHSSDKALYTIEVYPGCASTENTGNTVARMIAKIAMVDGPQYLFDEFRALAERLGLSRRVTGLEMMKATSKLGTCDARGHVRLSHLLVFMPRELRHAVMTHELAHLDHMDHSAAFYRRWEDLCGGPVRHYRRLYSHVDLPFRR